jgi:hypothetical protein
VLVIANPSAVPAGDEEAVKSFVERGGGLILFPGSQATSLEAPLLATLAIPTPTGVSGTVGSPSSLSFQKVDLDHPLFTTMFDLSRRGPNGEAAQIESPSISMSLQRQAGRTAHVIITESDGSPFLSEHLIGKGRVLYYSVAPVLGWSDLPLKGIFVPLMYRSILYASARVANEESYRTGEDIKFVVDAAAAEQYNLTLPDGTQENILPSTQTQGGVPALGKQNAGQPGFYDLSLHGALLVTDCVNVAPEESDTRKPSDGQIASVWKTWRMSPETISAAEEPGQIQTAIMQSRFGVELWKYFLALALLLVMAEMALARDSSKTMTMAEG